MLSKLAKSGAFLIIIIALTSGIEACPHGTFSPSAWSAQSWLDTSTSQESSNSSAADTNNETAAEVPDTASDEGENIDSSFISAQELEELLESETKPLIAYVSIDPPQGSVYILRRRIVSAQPGRSRAK